MPRSRRRRSPVIQEQPRRAAGISFSRDHPSRGNAQRSLPIRALKGCFARRIRLPAAMTHPQAEHATGVSPFRTAWFEVAKVEAGVYLVSEPGHVNSWLIEGTTSAVLFDTGLGVANIRKVAEEITPRKLLVVNSHYHFDHTGGNRFFSEFAIHRIGADLVSKPSPPELAEGYMAYTKRLLEAWGPYREADDLYFHLLTAERMIRELPDGFDPDG